MTDCIAARAGPPTPPAIGRATGRHNPATDAARATRPPPRVGAVTNDNLRQIGDSMANENSIDVYHALMALEEKVTGVAPDPENVTTDVALALADIFRTDVPMAQETAIVNAIDTITANYGGGGGVDVGPLVAVGVRENEGVPTVGDTVDAGDMQYVAKIAVGDVIIAANGEDSSFVIRGISFAAGTTLTTKWLPAFGDPTQDAAYAFLYTVETVEEVDNYKTVTILQDAVTMETNENSEKRYTFDVPEVEEGTHFAVNLVANWD